MPTAIIGNVKGDIGATPNLTIGTVQTLPTGASATATITGTAEDPVLNLGLPKGAQGDKGDTGDVTEAQMTEAIDTAIQISESVTRPISTGGTGATVNRVDITNLATRNSNFTDYNYEIYYYPYEQKCYLRLYAKTNTTLSANTEYDILNVGDAYKPNAFHACSIRCSDAVIWASVTNVGNLKMKTINQISSGRVIYVTAWWFVPSESVPVQYQLEE